MGVIEAREPLVDAVSHSAKSAARDPRFPALTPAELEASSLAVSILSPTRRASGPEEIEVGVHGVVLHKGVYLVHVDETVTPRPGHLGVHPSNDIICSFGCSLHDVYRNPQAAEAVGIRWRDLNEGHVNVKPPTS